eukprot:1058852-Heterocapsa_arctica.AAC.1
MGVCRYVCDVSVVTLGYESGMHRECIGYASGGMHRGMHRGRHRGMHRGVHRGAGAKVINQY